MRHVFAFCLLLFSASAFGAVAVLEITAPRGGEVFLIGEQQTIRVSSKLKSVTLQLSRDGGATFTALGTIDNSVKDKAQRNVLSLMVTGPGASNCILRASGQTTKGTVTVTSGRFAIVASLDIAAQAGALPQGYVTSGALADSAVTASSIADGSVTTSKIADGAVTTPKLAEGAVTTSKVTAQAVTSDKIGSGAASSGMVLLSDGLGGASFGAFSGLTSTAGNSVVMALNDAATTTTLNAYVKKAGDTMSGNLKLPIAGPAANEDAATKKYVDDANAAQDTANSATNATQDSAITTKWSLSGNTGTTAGTNFLGTTDNQALELKVNSARALRIVPAAAPAVDAPGMIGGFSGNSITSGVVGATIGGGGSNGAVNQVTDDYGIVAGGNFNQAGDNAGTTTDKLYATVGGGLMNVSGGYATTIAGGSANSASGDGATIGGGQSNVSSGSNSTVAGGYMNEATDARSTAAGGYRNKASGSHSAVVGGQDNQAIGTYSSVGGGISNQGSEYAATAAGGMSNFATAMYSTVSGGQSNQANGTHATVSGGSSNVAASGGSAVGGGQNNQASGAYSTVAGGNGNLAGGYESSVNGGEANQATGYISAVLGGSNNQASGTNSTVAGGYGNQAAGDVSFVAGTRARNSNAHSGVFLFADSTNANFVSATANEFAVRATGGVRLVTAVDGAGTPTKTFSVANNGDATVQGALNATGAATLAGGVVTPTVKPASDSTTALQLQDSAGSAVVTVDTVGHNMLVSGAGSRSLLFRTELPGYVQIRGDLAGGNFDINNQGAGGNTRLYANGKLEFRTSASGDSTKMTIANNGDVTMTAKLNLQSGGSAPIVGTATLAAGTIIINTSAVTASSIIIVSHATPGGTMGNLSIGAIVAGTSFVINSDNAADTSTVNWWIVN